MPLRDEREGRLNLNVADFVPKTSRRENGDLSRHLPPESNHGTARHVRNSVFRCAKRVVFESGFLHIRSDETSHSGGLLEGCGWIPW